MLEKYMNKQSFLEKSLKIKPALKTTGKALKGLEKSFNFTVFYKVVGFLFCAAYAASVLPMLYFAPSNSKIFRMSHFI